MSDNIEYDTMYAVIDGFRIDKEAHGILTMHFRVTYDNGWSQGVGGYCLDGVEKDKNGEFVKRYDNTEWFMDFLIWVYKEFDCNDYANLQSNVAGKPCIVYFKKGEGSTHNATPIGIKPFKGRDPMIFPEFYKKYNIEEDED